MMENAVTSVAVPEVEGIAQKCAFFLSLGIPNTLHISSKVHSGYSYLIHIALAASIGEPPPIATIQSGWKSSISAAPFITVVYRRIRLNAVDEHYFQASFLQIVLRFVKEAETLHRAAADTR